MQARDGFRNVGQIVNPRSIAREARRRLDLSRPVRGWPAAAGDTRPRLVITGAGGKVGQVLRAGLEGDYAILGLDMRRAPGVDRVADVRRLELIAPAFEGVDVVIDLAADSRPSASWESAVSNNVASTSAVLEAAHRAGVSRVVLASSNHVTGMYVHEEPYASILAGSYTGIVPGSFTRIGVDAPIRPDGPYAVGKVFGEAAGRYYSDAFGLSVICLRIGHVNRENRPKNESHWATLLTHRDLVELVRCCLVAPPSVRYGVYYGVSDNRWRIWEIDDAREAIGFQPSDDAESMR